MKNRVYSLIFISLVSITFSCKEGQYIIENSTRIDSLEDGKRLEHVSVTTYRKSDRRLISTLFKINNLDNDYKTFLLTGVDQKDGLTVWSIDSTFYNVDGFDTLAISYRKIDNKWVKNFIVKMKYNSNNKIQYFKSERPNDKILFSQEKFYHYDKEGRLMDFREFECSNLVTCDSTFKKEYHYNSEGKLDSTSFFLWENEMWNRKFKLKRK